MKHPWIYIIIILFVATVGIVIFTTKTQAPTVITTPATPTVPNTTVVLPAQKDDLIELDTPLAGATITSPLTLTGKARGNWYFEGSFPVVLVDWDGRIIAQGNAKANGNWMTTDYVPFTGTITFTKPDTGVSNRGSLILQKDNPSGDPKNDNALEIEIRY